MIQAHYIYWCTLFLLLYRLHPRSSAIRSRKLGAPDLRVSDLNAARIMETHRAEVADPHSSSGTTLPLEPNLLLSPVLVFQMVLWAPRDCWGRVNQ